MTCVCCVCALCVLLRVSGLPMLLGSIGVGCAAKAPRKTSTSGVCQVQDSGRPQRGRASCPQESFGGISQSGTPTEAKANQGTQARVQQPVSGSAISAFSLVHQCRYKLRDIAFLQFLEWPWLVPPSPLMLFRFFFFLAFLLQWMLFVLFDCADVVSLGYLPTPPADTRASPQVSVACDVKLPGDRLPNSPPHSWGRRCLRCPRKAAGSPSSAT